MDSHEKRSKTIGVGQALIAYGWWGFVTALFYHYLADLDPVDLVGWRVVTAIPVVLFLIWITGSWKEFSGTVTDWRKLRWLVLSALLILMNWFAFIWAVSSEYIIHASLGYYLNPLVAIALSALILKERLRGLQWISVAVAGFGVTLLSIMVGLPWIALALAITFPLYGLIRKKCPSSATVGLAVEMILLLPLMVALLAWISSEGHSSFEVGTSSQMILVPLSGVVTVVPLLGFSAVKGQRILSQLDSQRVFPSQRRFLDLGIFSNPSGVVC